jgi:hypothetical protein
MQGYNDDLVMSFGIGLWIRETALRLRAEGVELQKKTLTGMDMNPGIYITETNPGKEAWEWDIGNKKDKESLEWLIN